MWRRRLRVFVNGVGVDWSRLFGSVSGRVDLPTYAFQRERFWLEAGVAAGSVAGSVAADPVDAAFWTAVDSGDLAALTGDLGVGGDRPVRELLPVLAEWRRGQRHASVVDGWRYTITWKPLTAPGSAAPTGRWLVVNSPEDAAAASNADRCAAILDAQGVDVIRLSVGTADGIGNSTRSFFSPPRTAGTT